MALERWSSEGAAEQSRLPPALPRRSFDGFSSSDAIEANAPDCCKQVGSSKSATTPRHTGSKVQQLDSKKHIPKRNRQCSLFNTRSTKTYVTLDHTSDNGERNRRFCVDRGTLATQISIPESKFKLESCSRNPHISCSVVSLFADAPQVHTSEHKNKHPHSSPSNHPYPSIKRCVHAIVRYFVSFVSHRCLSLRLKLSSRCTHRKSAI